MIIKGVLKMSSMLLPKHFECAIADSPKEGCYLLINNKTGWVGGLCADLDNRKYNITIIFDMDKVSLGYFKEFLKDNDWKEDTEE